MMNYPNFFDEIESITLEDKLSNFLGAFKDGVIEFNYLDVVKIAGHSCPTVLGAYLMCSEGLKALYKLTLPKRGEIKVEFRNASTEGTTGVVANVISAITAATTNTGFKGISGNFDRRNLLFFEQDISSSVKFTRLDTNESVDVYYDCSSITFEPMVSELMKKIVQKKASDEEKKLFSKLWQDRVEKISKNIKEVINLV